MSLQCVEFCKLLSLLCTTNLKWQRNNYNNIHNIHTYKHNREQYLINNTRHIMRSYLLLLSRQNQISDDLEKQNIKSFIHLFFYNNLRFGHWSSTFYALRHTI